MTEQPDDRRMQQALRDLPAEAPDADFRARLRERFVSGTLGEAPEDARDARAADGATAGRVIRMRSLVVGTLAAAAVAAGIFFALDRGPAWRCTGVTGSGRVHIGERVVAAVEAQRVLEEIARPGVTVRAEGDVTIDFLAGDLLLAQMAPGSTLRLPGTPGRWTGRTVRGAVDAGEVRFTTGPSFPGTHLVLDAAGDTRVDVTGTTFAVISAADSACVCVLEGTVSMTGPDGTAAHVQAGRRRSVFPGGRDPVDEPIFPMEQMKLQMLRDQAPR